MRKRAVAIILILSALLTFTACSPKRMVFPTLEDMYAAAVRDAVFAESDEIFSLVSLTRDDDMVSWNDEGEVLLLTFHKYPESYVAGSEYVTRYGEVWTFTDREIKKWYSENKFGVFDWTLRFEQLIGVPHGRGYTHFSAMWVGLADVKRPAYEADVTRQLSQTSFSAGVDADFKAWFDGNIIWSYFDSAYPWTRLGYTYDWGNPIAEYGLTEFLIRKDAVVTVEYTMSTDEFLRFLEG